MIQTTPHILVIEDDKPSQTILGRILRTRNYSVATADDGKEALEAIQSQVPDLILLDVMMPELGGIYILKWLKNHYPQVPVIVLSCLDPSDKAAKEALALGALDFVTKPANFQELLSRIELALS